MLTFKLGQRPNRLCESEPGTRFLTACTALRMQIAEANPYVDLLPCSYTYK